MSKLKSLFIVVLGNLLLAISVSYFVLPHNILSGGTAGIALILNKLFAFDETLCIDIFILSTFLLGWLFLGKEFALKTITSSLVYPVFINILNLYPLEIKGNEILISAFGAIIAGIGIGIVIRENASTGGTEIPSLIIHKLTGVSLSTVFNIVDGSLVILGLIAYSFEDVMLGLVYIYISNLVVEKINTPRTSSAICLYIVSNKSQEICDYIHTYLNRGTTLLDGRGGYTNEKKDVILTVVSKQQYNKLSEKIAEIDKYSFVIVSDAKEVKGEGFTYEYRV